MRDTPRERSGAEPSVRGARPPEDPASGARIDAWRAAALDRVLVGLWGALTVSLVVISVQETRSGAGWFFTPLAGTAWLVLGLATWLRQLGLRARALGLMLAMGLVCVGGMLRVGFLVPNAFVGLGISVILLALFAGSRLAWWALFASVLAMVAVSARFLQGAQPLDFGQLNPHLVGNWARVIAIYAAATAAALACTSFLTSRLQNALRQSETLLSALSRENAQHMAALEQQRELEAQLRQSQKLEALGTLAGGIAHDFNNLLVVIGSHSALLQDPARRQDAASSEVSLRAIDHAVQRAASLTRQLLTFSRRQPAQHESIELGAALEVSLSMIRRLLPETVELSFSKGPEPMSVPCSQVAVDQVMMNLSVNARDAMPEGGRIEVSTARVSRVPPTGGEAQSYACLRISDSGPGIPQQDRQRIFDPFFTTKAADRGTGLGLSVVHGIVTQAGGFVEVDASAQGGAEFRIHLPRIEAQATPAETTPAAAPLRGDELILLVDDDHAVREAIAAMLRDAGYRVIICADGTEALEQFRRRPDEIALLIADAVMPKMGGGALHEALWVTHRDLPCLICSGYAAATLAPDFFEHGRRDFLHKPFQRDELLQRVAKLLEPARRARASREGGADVAFVVKPDPNGTR